MPVGLCITMEESGGSFRGAWQPAGLGSWPKESCASCRSPQPPTDDAACAPGQAPTCSLHPACLWHRLHCRTLPAASCAALQEGVPVCGALRPRAAPALHAGRAARVHRPRHLPAAAAAQAGSGLVPRVGQGEGQGGRIHEVPQGWVLAGGGGGCVKMEEPWAVGGAGQRGERAPRCGAPPRGRSPWALSAPALGLCVQASRRAADSHAPVLCPRSRNTPCRCCAVQAVSHAADSRVPPLRPRPAPPCPCRCGRSTASAGTPSDQP